MEACSQILLDKYDEDTKELYLITSNMAKITEDIKSIIRSRIDEYFGKDVKIIIKTNKEV